MAMEPTVDDEEMQIPLAATESVKDVETRVQPEHNASNALTSSEDSPRTVAEKPLAVAESLEIAVITEFDDAIETLFKTIATGMVPVRAFTLMPSAAVE